MTTIELYQPIEAIAAEYTRERALVDAAAAAIERMNQGTRIQIDLTRCAYNGEHPLTTLKQAAWRDIITKSNATRFMSKRQHDDLNRQLYKAPEELPEITFESLTGWIQALIHSTPAHIQDACREVFEMLTPQKRRCDAYKTNEPNRAELISSKVILTWLCETRWNSAPRLSQRGRESVQYLDRVFSLLDGKATPDHPHDSVTACEIARQNENPRAVTEYFDYRMCLNGNLHITIRRHDLLKRLNTIAAGKTLNQEHQHA